MIKKKKTKKKPLKSLIKKADEIASRIVRKRDGRCLYCGKVASKKEPLQAHHYIITKGRSTKHRWDLRNLVSLCYYCHMFLMHSTQTCLKHTDTIKKAAIMNHIVTEQEIEEIKHDTEIIPSVRSFVETKIEELKQIEETQNDKQNTNGIETSART